MFRSRFSNLLFVIVVSTSRAFADGSSGSGAILIANGSPTTQDFNSLSSTASPSNVLPTGWYLTEIGTGAAADGSYVVGTGSSNTGGAYSFGASGSSERSLGSVASGTAAPIYFGAKLTNNASGPITGLAISFTGEIWRRGPSTETDSLTFSYSITATGLNTGSFVNFTALNFNSPGNACASAAGATNGNSASCRVSVSGTVTGLSVSPGASIWIRWMDTDTGGSDDGLAIDDVSVSALIGAVAKPPTATGSASPNPVSPGQQTTLSGNISPGQNPNSQSLGVTCDLSGIAGSSGQSLPVTGSTFSYTVTVGGSVTLGVYSLLAR